MHLHFAARLYTCILQAGGAKIIMFESLVKSLRSLSHFSNIPFCGPQRSGGKRRDCNTRALHKQIVAAKCDVDSRPFRVIVVHTNR